MAATMPRPLEKTDLAASLESWFKYHGVPQFSNRYSVTDRLGVLLFLMLSVVAFELGAAPYLRPSAPELLLALVVLMCLSLCVKPALRQLLEPDCPKGPKWSIAVRLAVLVGAAYVLWRSPLPPLHSNAWVNFTVLLLTAASTAALSSGAWRSAVLNTRPAGGMALLFALILAVIVFALEGSVFPGAAELTDGDMRQAVPAVGVTAVIFLAVLRLSRGLDRAAGHDVSESRLAVVFPAAPLITLLLGLETALLPHTSLRTWEQLALTLTMLALLLLVPVIRPLRRVPIGRAQLLPLFAALLIGAYPAIVGLYLEFDVFGNNTVEGFDAFLLTGTINSICLLIAFGVVRLGLDRVVGWAGREALADFSAVVKGLARGLPLLLILTVFLLMQAELWQVAFLTGWIPFVALVAIMAAVGLGVMLVSSSQELDRRPTFEGWTDVREFAREGDGADAERAPTDRQLDAALDRLEGDGVLMPRLKLRGRRRFNAVLVVAVYQAIIFVPLALFAGLVFWGLARLAVPEAVAAEWIYGDGATTAQIAEVTAPALLAEPWPRVAVVLAAFSFLYLAVQIPSSKDQRKDFLGGAERGIKQRLARLLVYRAIVGALREDGGPVDTSRARPHHQGRTRWSGRSGTRPTRREAPQHADGAL